VLMWRCQAAATGVLTTHSSCCWLVSLRCVLAFGYLLTWRAADCAGCWLTWRCRLPAWRTWVVMRRPAALRGAAGTLDLQQLDMSVASLMRQQPLQAGLSQGGCLMTPHTRSRLTQPGLLQLPAALSVYCLLLAATTK